MFGTIPLLEKAQRAVTPRVSVQRAGQNIGLPLCVRPTATLFKCLLWEAGNWTTCYLLQQHPVFEKTCFAHSNLLFPLSIVRKLSDLKLAAGPTWIANLILPAAPLPRCFPFRLQNEAGKCFFVLTTRQHSVERRSNTQRFNHILSILPACC